jgi:outer membrane protein assembly factor BamB
MKKCLYLAVILFSALLASCQPKAVPFTVGEKSQWRGEHRDGIYYETGLLKVWPDEGPQLLWLYEGLGDGYSSAAVANGRVYVTGLTGENLVLHVLDIEGQTIAKKEIGKEESARYPGPRSSVTVLDGKLYLFTAYGEVFCLDEVTLDVVWTKNVIEEYDSEVIEWGMCETFLIVGDKLYVTVGGEVHNMVALNKDTGDLIWTSAGKGWESTYCSPQYISGYDVPIVVTSTHEYIVGFHALTGDTLWSHKQINRFNIHPNTPLYSNGHFVSTTGYGPATGGGTVQLRLTNGGRGIEEVWKNEVDNQMGGIVKVGNYLYTSGHGNRGFFCADWTTGEIKYQSTDIGNGTIIYADGMLYYNSDRGEVALIKPNPEKFEIVSRFPITYGTSEHWAHLVISNGVLFVRHGDALMAYNIK